MTVAQSQLSLKQSAGTTRPEIELILCCARTQIDPTTEERIKQLLQGKIDWIYLVQIAARHGVMPLLYRSLNATCPELVHKPILSQLRDFFHTNAQRNLHLTAELLKFLKVLQDNDIPAIPFKGPSLAISAYGNLALRQFGDLDIWVDKRDFLRVITDITAQEYQTLFRQGWTGKLPLYKSININYNVHECTVFSFDKQVAIDIHKSLTRKSFFIFELEFEALWQRLEQIYLLGTKVPNIHPEDLLLILCIHASKHHWHKLQLICDIAELVQVNQSIEWEPLLKQAKTLGCQRMLLIGLILANHFLNTHLPEPVEQSIESDSKSKSLAMRLRQELFLEHFVFEASENFSYCFTIMERPRDKFRYSVGFILNKSLIPVFKSIIAIIRST